MLPEDDFFQGPDIRRCWERYCGFLDLSLGEYMAVQKRLLGEQIKVISGSPLGDKVLGGYPPRSVEEFLETAPFTTYADYEPFLNERREETLPEKPHSWCHTSGWGGRFKWIPYTRYAVEVTSRYAVATLVLASATERGEVRFHPGDRVLYNVGPRPYFTGNLFEWVSHYITFHPLLPLEAAENMLFHESIEKNFQNGLRMGVDIIFSIGSVLAKLGEAMVEQRQKARLSSIINPRVLYTIARGMIRSKLEKRPLLPRDLWSPKAVITGGTDTSLYRSSIAHYWGQPPFEVYASTEGGLMAMQSWTRRGMTFAPEVAFWEFIPEEDGRRSREDPDYRPTIFTMDQLQVGKSYEVVFSSFYGMPLVRYRIGDLITVKALEDGEAGIRLPQVAFKSRCDDIIDLGGIAKLDEKAVWQAVDGAGIIYREWSAAGEMNHHQAYVHLYIEPKEPADPAEVARRVDGCLKESVAAYSDVEDLLGFCPVKVTLLAPGTYRRYFLEREREGAAMGHFKPPRMNAKPQVVEQLLRASQQEEVA